MKNIFKIITILFFFYGNAIQAQTYTGDIVIESQAQLDALVQPNGRLYHKKEINGSIYIIANDISNLDALSSITTIKGDLEISSTLLTSLKGLERIKYIEEELRIAHNTNLTSLKGLGNLTTIKNIEIFLNNSLTSLSGLSSLKKVDEYLNINDNDALVSISDLKIRTIGESLLIKNNDALTSLKGLQLSSVKDIVISGNASLESLMGLENVKYVDEGVFIYKNKSLTSLKGIHNITSIGGSLDVWGNRALVSLKDLKNLTYIGDELHIEGNSIITSLDGLEHLVSAKKLTIEINVQLNDFCAVYSLVAKPTKNKLEEYSINYNSYNPTLANFKNKECNADTK